VVNCLSSTFASSTSWIHHADIFIKKNMQTLPEMSSLLTTSRLCATRTPPGKAEAELDDRILQCLLYHTISQNHRNGAIFGDLSSGLILLSSQMR
jgi:hypothetical protein